jgi:hypothetical protein
MKTVNIKGKEYVMVNERIKEFRKLYPEWTLESELVSFDDTSCIFKATVKDQEGRTIATGHAAEDKNDGYINKTSFIENCETSAWGRCLGAMGIGIDASIASAEEVDTAIEKQGVLKEQSKAAKALPNEDKIANSEVLAYIKQELPDIGTRMERSDNHTFMSAVDYEEKVKTFLLAHIHKKINPLFSNDEDTITSLVKHIKAEDPKYNGADK